jgi:hypothetical protein
MNEADEPSALARSGQSDPAGKLNARIDVPFSEETEAEIIAMATLSGISKAEWVRRTCESALHGELGMARRMQQRGRIGHTRNVGWSSEA